MPSSAPPMGAHVEIVELNSTPELPCIKPSRVRINGTDVGLIAKDGFVLDPGLNGEPTSVTLKLWVRSVEIKAE